MSSGSEVASQGIWNPHECPFVLEYSRRTFDDIRLAVMDAFYSLPRGGAEVGGLLFGSHSATKVTISDYAPLECEHAYGPSFTLSPNDHTRLAALVVAAEAQRKQIVGWYHSHTRSGIFLSQADLDVHNQYFPHPWQVALVIRPHSFEPARCGFFFRDRDGQTQATASCQEFILEAMEVRPAPAIPHARTISGQATRRPVLTMDQVMRAAPDLAAAAPERAFVVEAKVSVPEPAPVVPGRAEPAGEPPPEPARPATPHWPVAAADRRESDHRQAETPAIPLEDHTSNRRSSAWLYWLLVTALVGATTYSTRDRWMNQAAAPSTLPAPSRPATARFDPSLSRPSVQPVSVAQPAPAPSLALAMAQADGQLQIRWNRAAAASAVRGKLEIADGSAKHVVVLSPAQIAAGSFGYVRQSPRVDARLTIEQAGGGKVEDLTSFLGPLPQAKPVEDPDGRKRENEAAHENARLKSELTAEIERGRKLQKSLDALQEQIRRQQTRRLGRQSIDPLQ